MTKLWTLFGHILDKCPNYGLLFGNIFDRCPKFGHLFGYILDKCPNFGRLFGHILDKCPNCGHLLDTFWKGVQILVTILDRCPNFGNFLGTFWTFVQNVSILTSFTSTYLARGAISHFGPQSVPNDNESVHFPLVF